MRFVRYGKRNGVNSVHDAANENNLNWIKRSFWDPSGFWWPKLARNYAKQMKNLDRPNKPELVEDPNGSHTVESLHKVRIWI